MVPDLVSDPRYVTGLNVGPPIHGTDHDNMTTDVPMDWEPSFMTTEPLAQTGFGLCSGDCLPMAMSLSTMDQVQCKDNEPMDWQPQSPTDTGLVITPCLMSPTFYYLFHVSMIARLSAAFIILSFPPPPTPQSGDHKPLIP